MLEILAHPLDLNRTKDVSLDGNITFESLLLNENVLKGLTKTGFKKPSPIQIKAIPVGRCGFDMIVKAKSGTGKTLVYSVVALETAEVSKNQTEVLILAPTREIAVQIQEILASIGSFIEGLQVKSFIGGLPLEQDKEKCKLCHIAVGAPGRVKHLISEGTLKTNAVRLLVLDEVDKLMESSFLNDINEIYNSLPGRKQVITTSATYTDELKSFLYKYMLSPTYIAVENDTPLLLGLKQYVQVVKPHTNVVQQMKVKNEELLNLCSNISFTQCLIFTNYQTRAESISNMLNQKGWASIYISAAQSQTERLSMVKSLKEFKNRIMLSTDLTARGIDAANVDLVINYDIPVDAVTYLHRMGRAGRYGSSGVCINLASEGSELQQLQNILGAIGGSSLSIPKLPKLDGPLIDLLNVTVPSENHIYGIISSNSLSSSNVEVKKEIFELKDARHKLKQLNEKENSEPDLNPNVYYSEECKTAEDHIMDILDSSKKEVNLISEQLSDIDTTDLLNSLSTGEFKIGSSTVPDSVASYSSLQQIMSSNFEDVKKRKRSESCQNSIAVNSKDAMLEKPKLENVLYCKNKALLNVSKIISNETCTTKDLDSIQDYLNILKDQDKNDAIQIMAKAKDRDEIELLKDIDELETIHKSHTDSSTNEFDIEYIFKVGYESAIKSNSRHWQSYLPEEEIKRFQNLCLKEQTVDKTDIESNYDDYDMEEECCDTDSENKAVDNIKTNEDGTIADSMKWIPVERAENTNIGILGADITNWEHLCTYFDNCSEHLWQNGLSFQNVEEFDDWFYYDWQTQVSAVRNYIQQNIYVQEMAKLQEPLIRK